MAKSQVAVSGLRQKQATAWRDSESPCHDEFRAGFEGQWAL